MAHQDDIGLVLEAIVILYLLYINITLDIIITISSCGNLRGREYLFSTYNQGVFNPGHITKCKVWSKLIKTLCASFLLWGISPTILSSWCWKEGVLLKLNKGKHGTKIMHVMQTINQSQKVVLLFPRSLLSLNFIWYIFSIWYRIYWALDLGMMMSDVLLTSESKIWPKTLPIDRKSVV